jgi:hypothetical protein
VIVLAASPANPLLINYLFTTFFKMKTAYLFAVISLVFSVSVTATFQNDHRQGFGQGNNNNNSERFGQGNKGSNKGASQSTLSAAGSASSATSTSPVIDGASSVTSTSTAIEGASSATFTSTVAGGASNANSTSTAAGGASNVNSTSTGAGAAAGNTGDPQTSLTLASGVIATGFENNGQDVPTAGQVASLTSSNNFINFCLTQPGLPITNGKQITTGSCNPSPMGTIPSSDNMPSSKFVFPKNGDTSLFENTPFTIEMAIEKLATGNFVNAEENYFAAPQQVNANGQIVGHSHVVVEALSSIDQTTPTNPSVFAFFKGLNDAAVNGVLSANVTTGLPAGFYKLSSINTAANHQPVLVPVAQHGSLDDAVYFTVNSGGGASGAAPVASSSVASASAQPTQAKHGKRFHSRVLNY